MQHTTSQDNLPEIGKKMASQAHRDGGAERFAEAAVHKTIAVDLALITYSEERLKDLALSLLKTAKPHDANPLYLLQTVPGIGQLLSLGRLYEIHRSDRFPSVQAFASYARLVTCSPEAGGKRLGPAGKKIGNAHLTWAVSDAATRCWRNHPQGQQLVARVEKKPDKGKALSLLAHKLGRAVYVMLKRQGAFDLEMFLQTEGRSAGEPGASLDSSGMSLSRACAKPSPAASVNATTRLGRLSLRPRDCLDTRAGSFKDGDGRLRLRGLPLPRARHSRARHLCSARLLSRTV